MRILQLSSARHFGGGERHFVDLANALTERGHDVFVAHASDSPLVPALTQIPAGNLLALPLRNSIDVSSAWKLRKFARDCRAEIIHAHVARDYPLAALALGRSHRTKLVVTRHVLFPLGSIHRLTRRRVAHVIAVSNAVAAGLRAQNIFAGRRISVVHHGLNLSDYGSHGKSSARPEDGLVRVGILGELSPVKGQDVFVRAAAMIAGKERGVEFIIAGADHSRDGENRRKLEALIEELDLSDKIRLLGEIESVPDFLSSLDLFVSASSSEAFGIAIVEAMACGVPVIASMTEGAREVIKADQTGRLVPIGDAAALAGAVIDMLNDQPAREMLAANALRDVAERFSLARMVDEIEQVYRAARSE